MREVEDKDFSSQEVLSERANDRVGIIVDESIPGIPANPEAGRTHAVVAQRCAYCGEGVLTVGPGDR